MSAGMCMSIITGTTPLSGKTWGLANITTARALEAIGRIGGPRCCKRDSFTAVIEAAKLIKAELGTALDMPPRVTCAFSCRKQAVPWQKLPVFSGQNRINEFVISPFRCRRSEGLRGHKLMLYKVAGKGFGVVVAHLKGNVHNACIG